MSIATILGFVFGLGLVGAAILQATTNFAIFIDPGSLMIVVGGTLASAFISYEPRYVIGSLKEIGGLFKKPKADRKLLTTGLLRPFVHCLRAQPAQVRIQDGRRIRAVLRRKEGDAAARPARRSAR